MRCYYILYFAASAAHTIHQETKKQENTGEYTESVLEGEDQKQMKIVRDKVEIHCAIVYLIMQRKLKL